MVAGKASSGAWFVAAAAGCLLIAGLLYTSKWRSPSGAALPHERNLPDIAGGGYADPASCASCHRAIAATYRLTGMARSFSKARADDARLAESGNPIPDLKTNNRIYHAASD